MFSQEERGRAVGLYCSTSMTTQQVVDHLGYPTRQCLERWLRQDPIRHRQRLVHPTLPGHVPTARHHTGSELNIAPMTGRNNLRKTPGTRGCGRFLGDGLGR